MSPPRTRKSSDQIKELLDTRVRRPWPRWRRHRFPRLSRWRREIAYAGRLQWLPSSRATLKARHRKHAAPLCSRGRLCRAGRVLTSHEASRWPHPQGFEPWDGAKQSAIAALAYHRPAGAAGAVLPFTAGLSRQSISRCHLRPLIGRMGIEPHRNQLAPHEPPRPARQAV